MQWGPKQVVRKEKKKMPITVLTAAVYVKKKKKLEYNLVYKIWVSILTKC